MPRGEPFRIRVWTGASTAPGTRRRAGQGRRRSSSACPTNPTRLRREKINAGELDYVDIHLSPRGAACLVRVPRARSTSRSSRSPGIREDGALIPSSSVGNNKTWLDQADKVILEVNRWQPPDA